jgi:diguanylate cyclase (GGDEF)-like protein
MKSEIYDTLTHLYNRQYLFLKIEEEIKRCSRIGKPFSLLLLDLDQFKSINDAFGHLRGDAVLQKFAHILQSAVREMDLVFRYAGDEFAILLPETGKEEALQIAKRVQKTIEENPIPGNPPIRITASIGIATFPIHGKDPESILQSADRGMFEAKLKGGNSFHWPSKYRVTAEDLLKWVRSDRIIGRGKELQKLLYYYEESLSGKGSLILISGEAGIGKTRLAEEILKRASLKESRVLSGRNFEATSGIPYFPIREMLKDVEGFVSQLTPGYREEIEKLFPKSSAETDAALPENIYRLYHALSLLYFNIAEGKGLVILFDDLHWADDATFNFLHYLIRNISHHPILILGTYRTEESLPVGLVQLKGNVLRERLGEEIFLGPLAEGHVRILLRIMFHKDFPEEFVKHLHRETEGNPFYIEEMLRELINRGYIYHDGEKVVLKPVSTFPLPTSIEALVERRLSSVDEEIRQVLEYAAVYGKTFPYEVLKLALRADEGFLWEILDDALAQRIIDEISPEEFAFTHIKIRDVLYEQLSPLKKRRIHRELLRALETLQAESELLAHHAFKGEVWEKAVAFSKAAAEKSKRTYAYREALKYLEQGIYASDQLGVDKLDLMREKAEILQYMGRPRESLIVCEEGLKEAKRLKNKKKEAEFLLTMADVYFKLANMEKMERITKRAQRIFRELNDKVGLAKTWHNLGIIFAESGKFEEALKYYKKAFPLYKDEMDITSLLNDMGLAHFHKGDIKKAFEYLHRSLDMKRKIGEKLGECTVLNNMGILYDSIGQLEKALSYYKNSLEIAKEKGFRSHMTTILSNIGTIYTGLGKINEALFHLERALEIEKEIGNLRNQATILNNLAILYQRTGNIEKALEIYTQSLKLREKMNDPLGIVVTKTNIGRLYLCKGDFERALKEQKEAFSLVSEQENPRLKVYVQRNLAQIMMWEKRFEEALKILKEAEISAKKLGDLEAERRIVTVLSEILILQGKKKSVENYIERAISLSKSLKTSDGEAEALIVRSFLKFLRGDERGGRRDVKEAFCLLSKSKNICIIRWLINLRDWVSEKYPLPSLYNFEDILHEKVKKI